MGGRLWTRVVVALASAAAGAAMAAVWGGGPTPARREVQLSGALSAEPRGERPLQGARRPPRPSVASDGETTAPSLPDAGSPPSPTLERPRPPLFRVRAFLGEPDEPRLRVLREVQVRRARPGYGGRSVGLRLRLTDGNLAYFKPEQRDGTRWQAEVAAYFVDRALGLGRVPPVVARAFPAERLRRALQRHPRGDRVVVRPDGTVRGALVAWISGPLPTLRLPVGWERWVRQRGGLDLTPFQRFATWREQLRRYRETGVAPGPPGGRWPDAVPDRPDRPAELSDLVVFDYLVRNTDRWSETRSNLRTRGRGGPLVFLDQGAAFAPGKPSNAYLDNQLRAVQKFRRSTIEALRDLDLEGLRRLLTEPGPLGPLLSETQWQGFLERRRRVLEHVQALVERYGRQQVLVW